MDQLALKINKRELAIAAILFIAIIALIIRANSFSIALRMAGLNSNYVRIIEHDFGTNDEEFKVIETSSKDSKITLSIVTKNRLGFWKVSSFRGDDTVDPHFTSIAWIKGGGSKRFSSTEDSVFENEWHYAYCGDNAIKEIKFLPGQIPENVTVNIQQGGSKFWIHVISFADPGVLNRFDVKAILEENKCIPIDTK
ncbi:hypothetical protein [Clostridium thermarum]|uniref:hypothetical protein n=1 Tax=Clostridium thermarum TaxID=1716543 RepID=UPI00111D3DEC|nr:hypothetical protein [Clostridium thermarum]